MADADSIKRCSSCGESKPHIEFHKKKSSRDGLNSACKACNKAAARAWYDQNPAKAKNARKAWAEANADKKKEINRDWYQRNKDKVIAQSKAWASENPDRVRESARLNARKYYAMNPEKYREAQKRYRERNLDRVKEKEKYYRDNNKEKVRAAHAAWKLANPEKAKASLAAWEKANPEKRIAVNANRRARKRNADGSYTAEQIDCLKGLQKDRCAICAAKLSDKYHRDHIMPLALGGTNDISNIQLLCQTCNCRKGAKHPIEYAQQIGRLL